MGGAQPFAHLRVRCYSGSATLLHRVLKISSRTCTMNCLRSAIISAAFALACVCAAQTSQSTLDSTLTAEQIMARVAANQDRAEAERSHYVYVQHAKMTSRRG